MPVRSRGIDQDPGAIEVAIENAVKLLAENGISRQFVIIRPGKWDIPAYLVNGSHLGADLSYLVADASPSVPHSLDTAHAFVQASEVVLVFPDIVFRPRDAIAEIVSLRRSAGADVALALVPSSRGDKVDIVDANDSGDVRSIAAKPGPGVKGWTWVAASWSAVFTRFLHEFLASERASPDEAELYVGDVISAAIGAGLSVCAARFPDGDALDVGTVEDLAEAWERQR
jgi:glucose-1-phosphate thymidylyltransferase